MRRKDREMNKEFAIEIIDKSKYGVLSMVDEDNMPYGIPISIARYGDALYFHSAMEGRKVRIFETNPNVSISFVGDIEVPEIYTKEELDEIEKDKSKIGLIISNVFTTEFESAVVKGKVKLVQEEDEKIEAMRAICKKYTPEKMDYFNRAIDSGLNRTNIYRVGIEKIDAKRKKYDINGKEMKWGRME